MALVLIAIVCGSAVGIPVCLVIWAALADRFSAFSLEGAIQTMIVAIIAGAILGSGFALFLLGKISNRT